MPDAFDKAVALADMYLAPKGSTVHDLDLASPPTEVWAIDGHRHSESKGHDVAVLCRNESEARVLLPEVIGQTHHDCKCDVCAETRVTSKLPTTVKLRRIR